MNGQPRVWFGVFITLVFIAGVATGSLLERVFSPRVQMMPGAATAGPIAIAGGAPAFGGGIGPGGGPGMGPGIGGAFGPGELASGFARELSLDETQRKQVEAIFEARRQRLGAIRDGVRERFEEERRALDADIERVLTPAQRDKFRAMNDRVRARGFFPPLLWPGPPAPGALPGSAPGPGAASSPVTPPASAGAPPSTPQD